jgi:N-methylhydantoinase B
MTQREKDIDPITLEILWSRMRSVVDEAAANFVRTSFSTLVREANDFAVVLTDRHGRNIAQSSQSIPSFISTLPATIRHFIEHFGVDDILDGDVFITNDPWLGSGHLNDASIAMPIFRDGRIVGFSGVVSHLPDIGGRLRNPQNVEIYEEGLQIPPMRIIHAGSQRDDIFTLIRANVRVPDETEGDIWAMIGCCRTLGRELNSLLDATGVVLDDFASIVVTRTEQAMRDAISVIPDGTYTYKIENDGPKALPGGKVLVCCAVTVAGDEITVDYSGSTQQVDLAINTVLNYTFAYTAYALKAALAPWIPNAEGSFAPIRVKAPQGCILNPTRPAPTGARGMIGHLLPPAVFGALAQAVPERVQAAPGSPSNSFQVTGIHEQRPFVINFFQGSGQGAGAAADGADAVSFPSNLANTPIEVLESQAPVIIHRRSIRRGSGGDGRKRGGDGIVCELEMRGDAPAQASILLNRLSCPAPGLQGGEGGACARLMINGQSIDRSGRFVLNPGDRVVMESGGGGGFGAAD